MKRKLILLAVLAALALLPFALGEAIVASEEYKNM